jgi:L-asparaginase
VSHLATARVLSLPRVAVLATGGTIAGQGSTSGAYSAAKVPVDALLEAVPGLGEIAEISHEQVSQVGSQDMSADIWVALRARIEALSRTGDVSGVVVAHGTDTLEETAYFLNLTLRTEMPVVLTAAMRPASAPSADGPANILQAVAVASDPSSRGRGVMVVLGETIHSARDVRKFNTTSVEAFSSADCGALGRVISGRVRYFRGPIGRHTVSSELAAGAISRLPRVDILHAYAGMPADLVEASVAAGARGIVVAGVGNGNMPKDVLQALADATRAGVVVVRASRVPSGPVTRNLEVDDDRFGFVASEDLNPAKARVLLALALLQTCDPKRVQRIFSEH